MSRQGLRLLKLPTAGKVSTARRGFGRSEETIPHGDHGPRGVGVAVHKRAQKRDGVRGAIEDPEGDQRAPHALQRVAEEVAILGYFVAHACGKRDDDVFVRNAFQKRR
jgi:hypothetical protein